MKNDFGKMYWVFGPKAGFKSTIRTYDCEALIKEQKYQKWSKIEIQNSTALD